MDERQRRRRVRLAGALLVGTIALLGMTAALFGFAPADRVAKVAVLGVGEGLVASVTWLAFAMVGAIIVRHQPDNVVGWICAVIGFGVSLIAVAMGIATLALTIDSGSRSGQLVAWLAHVAVILLFAGPVFLFLRFPTGRPLGPRFARFERVWMVLAASTVLVAALEPGPLVGFGTTANPFGLVGLTLGPLVWYYAAVVFAGLIIAVVSVVVRFRRGSSLERRQLVLLGAAAALVAADVAALPLTSPELLSSGRVSAPTYFASTVALTAIPDRSASPSSVITFSTSIGSSSARSSTASCRPCWWVSTLSPSLGCRGCSVRSRRRRAAPSRRRVPPCSSPLLFRPVRARAQRAIDRQFDRERYEATRTVEAFARAVRGEVEIDAIVGDLLAATVRTVHPAAVGCWIRGTSR